MIDNSSIRLSDDLIKNIIYSNDAKKISHDSMDKINKSKFILKSNNSGNNNQLIMNKLSYENPENKNINSLNERNNKKNRYKKNEKENIMKERYANNSSLEIECDSGVIQNILFPYRYYLCSIFIKHGDISKRSFFLTKKFITVYNFICKLFDISSYLIMQKEFEILKTTIFGDKYRDILSNDNEKKLNINELNLNVNTKEYLKTKEFFLNIRKK